MRLPLPKEQINRILDEMAAKSGIQDGFVSLIVTRGLTGVRGATPEQLLKNNLYMFIQPYIWVMQPEVQRTGGSAIVARTVRRTPVGSMDPTVKNLQWGDLTRGILEASDRGAMCPFLTDGDGNLTEGSGFNIVLVKDGILFTPERGVLEGVTRKSVLEIARANGIDARVEFVPVEMAYLCDEIFMCTTAGGIMPVTSLDGKPVKDGRIGPITKMIWDEYWAMHYDSRYSYGINYGDSEEQSSGTPRAQKL
jgi:branched-subunit amino acid aminotransferase/4-amino-4-deoxychorismate lyase